MPTGVYVRSEAHKRKLAERWRGSKNPNWDKYLSKEHREKLSEAHKGKHPTEESKHKMSIASSLRKHTELTKKKMSESRMGEKNPSWGKHHSEEHKQKLREATSGEKSPTWKGGEVTVLCKLCGNPRRIPPSHIIETGNFCSRKCKGIWITKHMIKKDTSIEVAIEKELIARKIPYLKQAPIEGIALVDFLLSNKIIIQADGDYWHSEKINKGKDLAQDTVLGFKGYTVYRFTETEIKKSPAKCINKILRGRK